MEKDILIIGKFMHSGLCNNLKNVLSCIRIKKYLETNMYIEPNVILHTLFDFPIEYCNLPEPVPKNVYPRDIWRFAIFDTDQNLEKIANHPYSLLFPDFEEHLLFSNYQNNCIDTVYRPDLFHEIYMDYGNIFGDLIIKPKIQEKIEEFAKTNFKENMVSVHIRSWSDYGPRAEHFRIEPFYDKIAEYKEKGYTFFISSDDIKISQKIQQTFGEDTIILYSPEENELPLISAFIEVMLLSKNDILIGTKISTFTEMAYIINYHRFKQMIIL